MTTNSTSLTFHSKSVHFLSASRAIALTVLLVSAFSVSVSAEEPNTITDRLPPPPPLSPRNRIIKHKYRVIRPVDTEPPTYASKNQQREYTFSAPSDETAVNGETEDTILSYKVEVFDNGEGLLNQIRDIEPKAFQKGEIIQVGIFSERDNAEDLVRKLARQGFWARIVIQ